jgi:molybdopterin converting factor small subunit
MEQIEVKVNYFGLLKNTLGLEEERISVPPGKDVGDVLRLLSEKYGEQFTSAVLRPDGRLRALAKVIVDGKNVRDGDGVKTKLEGFPEMALTVGIFPMMGG